MTHSHNYIEALYPELKEQFESNDAIKQRIKHTVDLGLFEGVKLMSEYKPTKAIHADLVTRQIQIYEWFISYLWCVSCYIIGIVDIYHDKAKERPEGNVTRLSDHPDYRLFDATLAWGRSLKDMYSSWPDYIPNPTQDSEIAVAANTLWMYVVRSLMYHELGHLSMHSNSLQLVKDYNSLFFTPTPDEKRRLRTMEIQADDYSLQTLLLSDINEHDRYMKYLGSAIAYLSNFLLLPDGDTRGVYHPDLNERLQTLLNKVTGLGDYYSTVLVHVTNIGLQVFMTLASIDFIEKNSDQIYVDFHDLKADIFDELKDRNAKYHIYRPFKTIS